MTALPSCPRCSNNERVIALDAPSFRRGKPIADSNPSWPFECIPCVLLFRGTDAEWVRMTEDRRQYQEATRKRSIPAEVKP